ncbi:MAG: fibronectin type III domain-containing protein [Rhodopila sp.]|nr:fibronectin type III domain-containing protein [Rhodopila sp.]
MKRSALIKLLVLCWLLAMTAGTTARADIAPAADAPPCATDPQPVTDGAFKVKLVQDSTTAWQPPGGEVLFSLSGEGIPAHDMQVWVCFRWHGQRGQEIWRATPYPRVVQSGGDSVNVAVTVPRELTRDRPNWFASGKSQRVEYTGFGLVPLADMHVVVTGNGAWKRIDFIQQVGITNKWVSLVPALLGPFVAWVVFVSWGRSRGIKHGLLLSIISSSSGVASLSQFQIMLWTFLFGAGVTYVMALSGSMIDIPQTALGLLGISGIATLGAKLNASGGQTTQTANPPGATSGLSVSGAATDTSVTLTWSPPAGGDPTAAYVVQVRQAGMVPWSTAASSVAAPPFAVTGLAPNTAYEFQVFAVNDAGSGPATMPVSAMTTASGATAPGVPGPVTSVIAQTGPRPSSSVKLTWAATTPAPSSYVVRYRPAGTWTWSTSSGSAASPWVIDGLAGGTDYEFQVFGVNSGLSGAPSQVVAARTAARTPQWSDLVVDGGEVDVTRTQMLLFTVITAVFVAMKLFDESQIPEIPNGILTLMGLSNGVYLAAKFVPGPK